MSAGTAMAICWLVLLAQVPYMLRRARKEVTEVPVTENDLNHARTLRALPEEKYLSILTAGRTVDYHLESGPNEGKERPAICVEAPSADTHALFHVHVLSSDLMHPNGDVCVVRRIAHEGTGPGCWSWPKRVVPE